MIKYFAKKYVINAVNSLLDKNKDNVGDICLILNKWCVRLTLIIEQLKKISSRCSDGKLDDKEVDDSIEEVEKLIKEF